MTPPPHRDAADDVERQIHRITHVGHAGDHRGERPHERHEPGQDDRPRPVLFEECVRLGHIVLLEEAGIFLLEQRGADAATDEIPGLIAEDGDQRDAGGQHPDVPAFPCAASNPPVNNSDSPGSSGNSSPVSTKTMTRIVGSTAEAKQPLRVRPSTWGRGCSASATTVVLMMLQHTGVAILIRPSRLDTESRRSRSMPIATPEIYAEMLGRAKENSYAFPAINCTSSETINAAIKGFADAGSDGIIQFSTGGAEFGSGLGVKDMVVGATALAEFAHIIAAQIPDQRRAAHRPLPQGQARHLRPAAAGDLVGTGRGGQEPAVPVAHVGRLGGADR